MRRLAGSGDRRPPQSTRRPAKSPLRTVADDVTSTPTTVPSRASNHQVNLVAAPCSEVGQAGPNAAPADLFAKLHRDESLEQSTCEVWLGRQTLTSDTQEVRSQPAVDQE